MNPLLFRFIYTIFYILFDITYVTTSKSVYDTATKRIQGAPMVSRGIGAMLAWLCMAPGWFFLIAPMAERTNSLTKMAFIGFIYGLLVFGTFNFTLYAMLENWKGKILIRDLSWGIISSIIVTVLYTFIFHKYIK
jgi:uncharacterized membrane protein